MACGIGVVTEIVNPTTTDNLYECSQTDTFEVQHWVPTSSINSGNVDAGISRKDVVIFTFSVHVAAVQLEGLAGNMLMITSMAPWQEIRKLEVAPVLVIKIDVGLKSLW